MRAGLWIVLVLSLAGVGCLGEALEQRALLIGKGQAEHLYFRDVRLFDGTSALAREHQDVEVNGGRVVAVKPTGETPPVSARVIEGAGKTLLPGLVDAHVHITAPGSAPWRLVRPSPEHNAAANLYAGVTTAYDLSGRSSDTHALREAIADGKAFGPRLYLTDSSISQHEGHPVPAVKELAPFPLSLLIPALIVQVKGPEDASAAVEGIAAKNVDYLKIILDDLPPGTPVLDRPTLKALVDEGHRRGLFVLVHSGTARQAVMAAEAGADALAHTVYRDELSVEDARVIARRKIPVIATVEGFYATASIARGSYAPSPLDVELHPSSWLEPVTGPAAKEEVSKSPVLSALMEGVLAGEPFLAANLRRLHAEGVILLVGSDSPLPGTYPGSGLHNELSVLVKKVGLPAGEVLLGATSRAARLFLKDPAFGSIEPGKVADLLLVKGNPLEDIDATRAIVAVFQEGREVRRNLP